MLPSDENFKMNESDQSEFYYPDENENINSQEEILNFIKEQKSVKHGEKKRQATWKHLNGTTVNQRGSNRNG